MNSLAASQFDDFLNFSNLFMLQISLQGNLKNILPRSGKMWGWSFENRLLFNLAEHFLRPNHMTLDIFLKFLEDKEYAVEHFSWKSPSGQVSPPLLAFFKIDEFDKSGREILIFAKNQDSYTNNHISLEGKKYTFQAMQIPGFIHNLNGPLSSILGRIELLKMKHPHIKEFDEVVEVGYRLQSVMDNLSFKIQNESDSKNIKVNLNRLLREELNFLDCDLFFKHQVRKVKNFSKNIPEFNMKYFSISGVFSELYRFIRQFADEKKEYTFALKSYAREAQIGFAFEFSGDFKNPGDNGTLLPYSLKGDAAEIMRATTSGLDNNLLAECMNQNDAALHLKCENKSIKCKFEFPLPDEIEVA